MNPIVRRIRDFISYKELSISAFERSIGASKGVLSRAMTNNTDIQAKWIGLIVENYPELSAEWLLTGRGFMIRSDAYTSGDIPIAQYQASNIVDMQLREKDEQIKKLLDIIDKNR
jgi:hypothetical protein